MTRDQKVARLHFGLYELWLVQSKRNEEYRRRIDALEKKVADLENLVEMMLDNQVSALAKAQKEIGDE